MSPSYYLDTNDNKEDTDDKVTIIITMVLTLFRYITVILNCVLHTERKEGQFNRMVTIVFISFCKSGS